MGGAAKKQNGVCVMLINDLTGIKVIREELRPFLLTYDVDVKTPAVTIIRANDFEFQEKAEQRGYPIIKCKDGILYFPNGWKIPLKRMSLIKTKIFHLMKRFYRLSDEIQIADNIKIHLINDWCEKKPNIKCRAVIFLLLSSYIYGGALKTEWFARYNRKESMQSWLWRCLGLFFVKCKFCEDLVYMFPEIEKNKTLDFYFYEQDFRGMCRISERK